MSYRHKRLNPRIKNLRPKKRIWKSPVFWAVFFVLAPTAGIVYLIFFVPKFQIKNIEVVGNVKVSSQEIKSLAFESIQKDMLGMPYKSIFLTNTKNVAANMLSAFPVIEKLDVKKKYPDSLVLQVVERIQFAVFCAQQSVKDCFSIDRNGIIFEELQNVPKDILVLTKETQDKDVFSGERIIDEHIMEAIYKIQENLRNDFQISVREAFVSNPLILRTSENWKLYFDPDGDIQAQITKMNLLLKDEITPSVRKNLQYIYLQYKDRAYYK